MSVVPHVFVSGKSLLDVMLVMVTTPFPVLVNVTAEAELWLPTSWLPNSSEVADKVTSRPTLTPVREMTLGLLLASLVMIKDVYWGPEADGEKVTLRVQLPPIGMVEHWFAVKEKSAASPPLKAKLTLDSESLPVFDTVMDEEALFPTPVFGNTRSPGTLMTGPFVEVANKETELVSVDRSQSFNPQSSGKAPR